MDRTPDEDEVARYSKELAQQIEQDVVEFSKCMAAKFGMRHAAALAMTGITAHTATLCAKLTCGDDPSTQQEKESGAEDKFFAMLVTSCKIFMPLARRMLADAARNRGVGVEVQLPRDRYIN